MTQGRVGIVVSGGPAPGINSVIGAATIRATLSGCEVLGIQDGFRWIRDGDTSHVTPLSMTDTSRIHFRGGSHLSISRASPLTSAATLNRTIESLERLSIDKLIAIGGEGTAYCAYRIEEAAKGRIRVAHVPKTIDNDLNLPGDTFTFGYQTARHHGVELVSNLMVDARTTSRWFFVVAMGRTAGHLALGIGKAAGATLTLIPEEFRDTTASTQLIVDTIVGSIIKRLASGRSHGIVVLAEGLADFLDPADLAAAGGEQDVKENLRVVRLRIGHILKDKVHARLKSLGIKLPLSIVAKHIGYELRCVDPVPLDMEYTRDLGFGAAKFLVEGGSGATMCVQNGKLVAMPFSQIIDVNTGIPFIRLVDIDSDRYKIARSYMIRLHRSDFDDPLELDLLAAAANLSQEQFRQQFKSVVEAEPRLAPVSMFPPRAHVTPISAK
ncbi:MAG: diphosphate--fructose-6-phosphate 1-phosphotransferase [Polyangiaceae bacterium]